MIKDAVQANRVMAVSTPLGSDKLLLWKFSGREEFSQLFSYELDLLSDDDAIDPTQIVGHPVAFRHNRDSGEPRYFHGFVNRFRYVGQNQLAVRYQATVVPWSWFLTQTTDCRIFQRMTAPQIIAKVFSDFGIADFDDRSLMKTYAEREYCVQYRESDFAFVSRLMEEEGIFYFYRHAQDKHTLVLTDNVGSYFELPDNQVVYADPVASADWMERIISWEHHYDFRPGKVAITDYNFEVPAFNLMQQKKAIHTLANAAACELYEFPGSFYDFDRGSHLASVRIEEQEAQYERVVGTTNYPSFTPGGTFAVDRHATRWEEGKEYTVIRTEISASLGDSYRGHFEPEDFEYTARFSAIPPSVVFRPVRATPRPIVEGPQTAVVVGPADEEIYTDEHGRIKVQFHWDREGQFDENSSCWIRVSQVHAGKGWGAMDLPRIGEEVIVDFFEGDPDRPMITGRVYNGDNQPPFALPAGKTRRGNTTKTYKGQGFNEMSMDDTPGQEQLRVNAQHNMDSNVNNNQTLVVGVDRTTTIGNNDTLTVKNDSAESVGNNKSVSVGVNMNVNVGTNLMINAGSSITLKCGASQIYMNSGGMITITGTMITTAAAASATMTAPLTQLVGAVLTTIGGANIMSGGVCHVGALGLASVSGSKKTDITSGGVTSIKGGQITLN